MLRLQTLQENVELRKPVLKPLRLIILSCLLICSNSFGETLSFASLVGEDKLAAVQSALALDPTLISKEFTITDFAYTLPNNLRLRLTYDTGVTALHIAAALGHEEMVKLLLSAGADKWAKTRKYKSFPAQLAVQNSKFEIFDILHTAGSNNVKVFIDLTKQRLYVYNGLELLKESKISSGRKGYETPTGSFIVTDKHRKHTSTIYKVPMPFFMRFSYTAIGSHQGHTTGRPASHGCIRLPTGTAKEIFELCPVGTRVEIY